ncbi:phosphatidylglycerophosphatase A [Desulfobulbus sp.]|uniref:phosphatidylglycerophosphatase A family protein n=1 Tax=Desulfobulbus sp. TaxID=895 RepID=UPI00286F48CE|nr:phosphatidylglycerophosphatase A [Desulfobulbus sp.]
MDRVLMFIATGAGSGYLPVAPGTWGSAVGVLLWLGLSRLEAISYLVAVAVLFVLGVFGAGAAEKIVDRPDPSIVVIDEIVGQLITLCFAPPHPAAPVAGFLLFRLFDILKPFPAGWIDRHLHGGLGVMLDDVVAGFYALLALHLGYWLLKML